MNRPAMFSTRTRSRRQGLTLTELMVTLVVAAVLLAISVPSMRELIARKRVEGVANELASDLRYLRSEAIQRHAGSLQVNFGIAAQPSTCYAVVTLGSILTSTQCNCALAAPPICADAFGMTLKELKTVMLPGSTGITLTASSALMALSSAGLPQYPSVNNPIASAAGAILLVSVQSPRGGKVCVAANGAARPTLCSVSGHEGTMPACPSLPAPCQA